MIAQTLTFHLVGLTDAEARKHCDMYAFALPELHGLVSQHWVRCERSGRFAATLVWESTEALREFRHSELYAHLALDPHVGRLQDEDGEVLEQYAAGGGSPRAFQLAAA